MYDLKYHNNNCIGCVKGGMWYWNKIREDFPEAFERMARLEREIGYTCITVKNKKTGKKTPLFLDKLEPGRGKEQDEIMPECSIACEVQLM